MPSTCQSGRGRSWWGHPWAGLTGRLHCCNQVASCLFAGKSPCRLRYLPWSYALSLEENSLALCLEGYVQQPELEHAAKLGVEDLMPFIWTCLQISALSAVPLPYHTESAAPLLDLWSRWETGNHLGEGGRVGFLLFIQILNYSYDLRPSAPQRNTISKISRGFLL